MTFSSWEKFRDLLFKLSSQPGYKPKLNERREGSPLISPATFVENTTRANANVLTWGGWAALDVDEYEGNYQTVIDSFRKHTFVCYSSASSKPEKPKFRLVLPLTEELPVEKIKHFWHALNREFNSLGDPQTKDLSRMYYVPARYPGAFQFILENSGISINPGELMQKHSDFVESAIRRSLSGQLPELMQRKILEYRKSKLVKTYTWSSWRDCPFVNRQMVSDYSALTSGWYSAMYRMMVCIANAAIYKGYPITAEEIESLCREIDNETGRWYARRPMHIEALRAIEFSLSVA